MELVCIAGGKDKPSPCELPCNSLEAKQDPTDCEWARPALADTRPAHPDSDEYVGVGEPKPSGICLQCRRPFFYDPQLFEKEICGECCGYGGAVKPLTSQEAQGKAALMECIFKMQQEIEGLRSLTISIQERLAKLEAIGTKEEDGAAIARGVLREMGLATDEAEKPIEKIGSHIFWSFLRTAEMWARASLPDDAITRMDELKAELARPDDVPEKGGK